MSWVFGFFTARTKHAARSPIGMLFAAITVAGLIAPHGANGQTAYEATLYNFSSTGGDGQNPSRGGLVMDSQGNLYGTTESGGNSSNCINPAGCGTVFELVYNGVSYSEKILHSFSPASLQSDLMTGDGAIPIGGLVMDGQGHLYGTTAFGGASGQGTVFELVNNSGVWVERIIHSFAGTDGRDPAAGLIIDSQGDLYGTTTSGGAIGGGTVFKLHFELVKGETPWTEEILHSFGGADGDEPAAGLTMDSNGVLYGTTFFGGGGSCAEVLVNRGCGTVFELVNNSGLWTEQIIHSFDGTHGKNPLGGLILDSQGTLWGTTSRGGSGPFCTNADGCGTVFSLPKSAKALNGFAEVYSFGTEFGDGSDPQAGLLMDSKGNVYGTTAAGGPDTTAEGTIFELVQSTGYSFKFLHEFVAGGPDGTGPVAPLVQNASGVMFGTTDNIGAVYQLAIAPDQTVLTNTSLTYAPNPPIAGSPVRFTALVTAPSLPGLVVDGGAVNFRSGTTSLATVAVLNSVATLSVDAEAQELIGDGTVTAQYIPSNQLPGGAVNTIFTGSSSQVNVNFLEPGVATTVGSNTFNGNQTVNGSVIATAFVGNGSGLTNVTAVGLNCIACVGNSQLGINYAGSASQGGAATTALTAAQALNTLAFGGLPLTAFPTLGAANTFTATQSMPGLNVTGSTQSAAVTTGSITIGGGTAVTEVVSATVPITLPAINPAACTTVTTGAVTAFTPGTSDTIALGLPSSLLSVGNGVFLMYEAWETDTSISPTVTIQVCNPSRTRYKGGDSGTIRVDIIKH